jgi:tetratricopeptide (TPR) repeat protein
VSASDESSIRPIPRRGRRLAASGPLVAALLALAQPLAAQAPAGDTKAGDTKAGGTASQIARDLFERGKAKWTLGHYDEAASLLAASNQQMPRAGTCMLLADAYERLGRLRTARDTFQLASKLARDSGDSQLEYRANTREAALAPRLPRIEVRVPQPLPRGLLVTLNGVELPPDELNAPTALDAGNYHLEARAPGYRPFARDIQLSNDGPQPLGARVISVQLSRGGEDDPAQPFEDASNPRETLAYWVGGAGAALTLGGVISLLVALDKNGASQSECGLEGGARTDDENACTPRGAKLRSDARTFAHLATAGTLLGLGGLGAGITLYLTAGGDSSADAAGVRWVGTF